MKKKGPSFFSLFGQAGRHNPNKESTHIEEYQHETTRKVHLLSYEVHFTTKDKWNTSLPGRLGTSPKD
jgi:hypothetical protein